MSYQQGYQYAQYGGSQGYAQMAPPQQQQQQQAYAGSQQTQYQHPMVVIPQQPRHGAATSQNSLYTSQSPLLPGHSAFPQQPSPQYYTAPPQHQQGQQYYSAPSQIAPRQQYNASAYSQPALQYGQQGPYQQAYRQQSYQTAPSQQNYSQSYRPKSSQAGSYPPQQQHQARQVSSQSPSLPSYHQVPRPPVQASSPVLSYPNSSPDPLHGPSNVSRGQVPPPQQRQPPRSQPSQAEQHQLSRSQVPQPQQRQESRSQPREPQQRSSQSSRPVNHAPQPQQRTSQQPPPVSQASQPQPQPQQRTSQPSRPVEHINPAQQKPKLAQPQQRVVTAVEIPHYNQQSSQPNDHDMARSAKRRRSNDGHAMPVYDASAKAKPTPQLQKQAAVASSALTELNSSQFHPTPQPSVDYQAVLLALSEEYVTSAYSMSLSIAAGNASEEQHNMYCALMSSAMACLESALNNYRQIDPRKEARIRLRLASLMLDECDADEEAEAIIGKGIALCERSRLPDLKYALHHVSVRSTFRQHPRAALKSLDKLVQEVETLHLQHWLYAFRFLRVSLGLEHGASSEVPATLKHLQALNTLANDERHIAAHIVAAALSAIVNLRSTAPDSLEATLRAMATARTHQLSPEMQSMPQVRGLLDCLDVTYGLMSFNVQHAHDMMVRMHNNFDSQSRELGWSKFGSFSVELGACSNKSLEQDTGGILRMGANGNAKLVMRWLTHSQLYALSYLLTSITMMTKNAGDVNVENSIRDGLKLAKLTPDVSKRSLGAMTTLLEQQQGLSVLLRLFSIVSLCGRYQWDAARKAIQGVRNDLKQAQIDTSSDIGRLLLYLEALCRQGLGDLKGALTLYGSPDLTFTAESKATGPEKDLRAIATLNSVYILRSPGLDATARSDALFTTIEQFCFQHSSKAIYCAANLAKAMAQSTIISTKQYLQRAVGASKEASNNLLQCIGMNIMTSTFFSTAIVGDQAEKSAHAARQLAKHGKNLFWTVVADGMYTNIKERCGRPDEANVARMEADSFFKELPQSLQEKFMGGVVSNGAGGTN